jgi:hypothetical protein
VLAGDTPILVHNDNGWCGVVNVVDGGTLYHSFDSAKGPVQVMANVQVNGTEVVLTDVAVYGDNIPRNGLGREARR